MEAFRLLEKQECTIRDSFWSRYISLVKNTVIPYQWDILNDRIPDSEPSHAIDNFRIAAGEMEGRFYGQVFQESDVSKWLEAVGNVLMLERDKELEEKADSVIDIIARAQQPDGYLDTYFIIEEPDKRWTNVLECHELYCAGHFIEGAVAYYLATGKEKVYNVAKKLADHIDGVFGPEEGKLHGYPGHQEIEIALLRLYDVSAEKRYLDLARYFIDTRGTNRFFEEEFERRNHVCFWTKEKSEEPNRWYNQFPYSFYNQFHQPVRQQRKAVGHAVRGVYMYTAMADLASRIRDESLFEAGRAIWDNIVGRQLYITGGIGATHSGEAFTADYDLPNDTNYSETCASIGLIFFAQKMLKMEADGIYGDVMEQALYNTVLGGMNYEGNRFFYVNPLAVVPETCRDNTERSHVKPVRQKWFACACCPPNIARLIGGLWQYVYTADRNNAYVHLYVGSYSSICLEKGRLDLVQETDYPWDDKVRIKVKADTRAPLGLALRIPGWSRGYSLRVNGETVSADREEKGFACLMRSWPEETEITLKFRMEARFIKASQNVRYNAGRAAIVRGPLVYCLEEADNGAYLDQIAVDPKGGLAEEADLSMPGGCIALKARGVRELAQTAADTLYMPYGSYEEAVTVKAVPYFLWNNRGRGEMQVWMRMK
ncbi:glycoside hydrolase family 127 protein [Enterocloster clostridioformis]|uniref:glycoside hydrolase family 127 protein n=1 Tax=Enterocloster clostridioformis TaxID=1531 RepID=UPI002675447F|nr:beta-L-arabinofuranosidase domain-containing protein [Enterocloster clostridioformis]